MEKKIILLEDMNVYQMQNEICDDIWNQINAWEYFAKDTLGKQLARAFDSIGANIAEGYGRYHYGEKIKFYYYARGSVFESQYWIKCATRRLLFSEASSIRYLQILQQINKEINYLIKACYTQKNNSQSQS